MDEYKWHSSYVLDGQFPFLIGAVRSKGPVVQYTQDLTSTGTQFKPMEPPQPTAPPAPPAPPGPALSPQAGDSE